MQWQEVQKLVKMLTLHIDRFSSYGHHQRKKSKRDRKIARSASSGGHRDNIFSHCVAQSCP